MDSVFVKEKNQSILPSPVEAKAEWTTLKQNKRNNNIASELNIGSLSKTGDNDRLMRFSEQIGDGTDDAIKMKRGFNHIIMHGTDELNTGAQVVQFYTEVSVEEETGFIERQNVLDRM